jgi:very-short-patch-repair endonuclease
MGRRGEVLIAIMNNVLDMAIANNQHWYRIPVTSVDNLLKECWPPQWLAFYQTKEFGDEAYAVNYYAQVLDYHQVFRWQLFPDDPKDEKGLRRYYRLVLASLKRLPQPILSRRRRRIVFIPTTLEKFTTAVEINDLYAESPLEDRLWAEFKQLKISAERQEFVEVKQQIYALDFAIYCASGKIDVETDGDTWHANREQSKADNLRDNALKTVGWRTFHFSTSQVKEQMAEYCIPTIVENVNRLGGLEEGRTVPRKIDLNAPSGWQQMTLLDSAIKENQDKKGAGTWLKTCSDGENVPIDEK